MTAPASAVKDDRSNAEDKQIAQQIKSIVFEYCQQKHNPVPAKEAIAAMAAVTGERCIEAASELPVRSHKLLPGQRVFSDRVNNLLSGDAAMDDLAAIPGGSVFGTIRDQLRNSRFQPSHFPRLTEIFAGFSSRIGRPEDWGNVPLSLPADNWPEQLPLRVAFDTRTSIDAAVQSISGDKVRCLHACSLAMAMMVEDQTLRDQLAPAVALTLTFEVINGMAKTAPMTDKAIDTPTEAMKEAQHEVIKIQ